MDVDTWREKNKNKNYSYFGWHTSGEPVNYNFNHMGYRGKFYENPDISVFGSSFSFGIGIDYCDCWHQNLGDYKVNCYAVAGWLINNNQIIENYKKHLQQGYPGKTIIQLREFEYNTGALDLPKCDIVCIDKQNNNVGIHLGYSSFIDFALDNKHPGAKTHKRWAKILKKIWNL